MTLIADLITLHRADLQVRALRSRVDSARAVLNSREAKQTQAESRRQELQALARQLQATMMNMEVESKAVGERIEALRTELNSSSNTKQYNALLTELKALQAKRDEIDERTLAQMERVEAGKNDCAGADETLTRATATCAESRTELAQRTSDVGERLTELERERRAAASHVSEDLLKTFETIAQEHDGETLAEIATVSAKHREYACTACNMLLPPALVVRAATDEKTIVQCPNCRRIVYFAEATQASA